MAHAAVEHISQRKRKRERWWEDKKMDVDCCFEKVGFSHDMHARGGFGTGLHSGSWQRKSAFNNFFSLFTCSIWLVNHGLYYSSPRVNEPGRKGGKKKRGGKQMLNHSAFTQTRRFIMNNHKAKTVLHDLMATLATKSLREALTTKQQQTKGRLCVDLGTQWGILLMFLMIYSPLF